MSLETGFFPLQGLSQFANSFMTFSKMKRSSEEKRRKSASAGKARSATAGFKVLKGGNPLFPRIYTQYTSKVIAVCRKNVLRYTVTHPFSNER
ncbi:hypothetical protein [Bacillus velezensis]|uniref:hypothetical protein n=1 Tax=Bacillus velezensis TaxID=492670 RepID=UPI002FFE5412